jgi:hypothetical protein
MNESNMQQNAGKPNDEIDIFEFCFRLWGAFKKFLIGIKDLIVSIIIFLIRKTLWIVSFALFGVILGFMLYSVSKPYYSSLLEGNTGRIDNTVMIDHINKLNQASRKPSLLANYLGINTEQAEKIRSIKAYYGIDINKDYKPDYVDYGEKYNPKDTMQLRVPSYIYIKVSVYDEDMLSTLRKGLFYYINNNAYIQELFKIDKQQREELLVDIEKEISKIDSLQRIRFRKETTVEKGQMSISLNNEQRIQLFYEDILKLRYEKQSIERSLEISDEPIVIIHDFTPLQHEERPILKFILVLGGSMAVLGVFCSLLWQYRKRIWDLIKEDSVK